MTIASLLVKLGVEADGVDKGLGSVQKKFQTFGSKLGKAALVGGAAGMAGLAAVAKTGFDEFQGAAAIQAQTTAALKSTGGAANVTADHISNLAGSLLNLSGVDDEAIQGAENMLLTFTNVRDETGKGNDVFDQASKTVLDMDEAMTQGNSTAESLKNTSILLGKALNDPVMGATALRRVGVSLTAAQQDQIKAFVKSGDTMSAQKIILHELSKEFGGSAQAIGDSMPGTLSKVRESFNNAAGAAVQGLMPILTQLAQFVTANMPQIQALTTTAFNAVAHVMQVVLTVGSALLGFYQDHTTMAKVLIGVLGAFVGIIVAVNGVLKAIAIFQKAAAAAAKVYAAAQWLLNAALEANPIALVVTALVVLGAALVVAWKKSETFRDIVKGVWGAVKAAVQAVVDWFTVTVPGAFQNVLDWLRANWPVIATVISGPFAPLVALATNAFGVRSALEGAFTAIVGKVTGAVGSVVDVMAALPGRLVKAVGNLGGLLSDAGAALVHGFESGITGALGGLLDKAHAMADKVKNVVKGVLGIFSPSRVMADLGRNVVEGMALGIDSRIPKLATSAAAMGPAITGEVPAAIGAPAVSTGAVPAGRAPDGDIVLELDGDVLARFTRKALTRTGRRNAGLSFA